MVILVGESGSGKSTIETLLTDIGFIKTISATTREKRKNEIDGKDYFFYNKKNFEEMIKNNEILEYTFYNNNYYGTLKKQLNKNSVIVVDKNGITPLKNYKEYNPVVFYLKVSEEIRRNRMKGRGDPPEFIENRILFDRKDFFNIEKNVDYIINADTNVFAYIIEEIMSKYNKEMEKIKCLKK